MALGEVTICNRGLNAGSEIEEPQGVGYRRAGPTDPGRDVLVAEPELIDELAIRIGRLERIQVFALEVLDERQFELLSIGELADDGRDPVEPGGLGRAQPALTGDELVAVDRFSDKDGLEDAVLLDTRGQ